MTEKKDKATKAAITSTFRRPRKQTSTDLNDSELEDYLKG